MSAIKGFGRLAVLMGLVFGALASTGMADDGGHGWLLPNSISGEADAMDRLFWLVFWIVAIVFVLTEGALVYFMYKYRARPGHKAIYIHGNHKLEILWTAIPVVILGFLTVIQIGPWLDQKDQDGDPYTDPDRVEVHIIGRQFNWSFRYVGADNEWGTEDDYTGIELVIPKDRHVVLRLRSLDVIHSFYMPHVRLKTDVVPGITTGMWFKVRTAGSFPIACAELCGVQHYTMGATMRVLEQDEWGRHVADKSKESVEDGGIDYSMRNVNEMFRFWPLAK